ncbi:hypothetical protein LB507_010630 [Fusarium sp. FIESC RH6]|nr:hypothetical protein LB507_010630 [Fusarium sp. FIESC RH6]
MIVGLCSRVWGVRGWMKPRDNFMRRPAPASGPPLPRPLCGWPYIGTASLLAPLITVLNAGCRARDGRMFILIQDM